MKNFFLILFTFQLFSCQNKSNDIVNKNDQNIINKNEIIEILEKQIKSGAAEEYGSYDDYGKGDLDALVEIENNILTQKGYKSLNDEEFVKRVEMIFKRKIDISSSTEYLRLDVNNKCNKELQYNPYTADNQDLYISKKNKFITNFFPIPKVVDYLKLFPEFQNLEKEPIEVESDKENLKITRWKDVPNLSQIRYQNELVLISRNEYLFNDNKASLAWLKANDEYFLESLVKIFGYTKDKDLLGWVMKRNESKANDFVNQFLFVRNCKGELEIREDILKYIEDNTTEDEKSQNYVNAIASYDINDKNNNWSEKEIIKIRAYIANTYDFLFMKYQNIGNTNIGRFSYLGRIFYNSNKENSKDWQQIEDNFKQNNYYNLPHLKNASSFALEFEAGAFY
ncbi:hypothetical protein [Chryseobacterium contaminans]|uniref:hypothetical protein n=1 Tax=Chryseobacterium contaminans TaxID=1423959 RepID=UPI003018C803